MKDNGNKDNTPCAGCTNCGAHAWALILDAYPPHHTKITYLVCVSCGGGMAVSIEISDMRDRTGWEELDGMFENIIKEVEDGEGS